MDRADQETKVQDVLGFPRLIFREDTFDPVTKIRRGRVYSASGHQPQDWFVQDSRRSDLEQVSWGKGIAQKVSLITYHKDPLSSIRELSVYPEVVLGKEPFVSIWKIISIESSIIGTPILTLKSYRSFGTVPSLIPDKIDEPILSSLKLSIEKVENSSNRLGPTDIVDRCRDTLSIVFGHLSQNRNKDLGDAIKTYVNVNQKGHDSLITWAGRIVGRLHPRGKPNELHRHGFRELSEEDAQLAIRCLWIVLVELGWASSN